MNIQPVPKSVLTHPLVEQTRRVLEERTPDQYSRVGTRGQNCFDVAVGKDSIPRVLQILDSLAIRFKTLGWEIKPEQRVNSYAYGFAAIYIESHAVALSVFESARLDFDAPTDGRGRQTFVLSGQLQLKLGLYRSGPGKKVWVDSENLLLEAQLDSFIDGTRIAASHIKHEWEVDQKVLAGKLEKERILKMRNTMIADLNSVLESWEKCNRIRDLLKAVAGEIEANTISLDRREEIKEWYEWASAYVESLDPVKGLVNEKAIRGNLIIK